MLRPFLRRCVVFDSLQLRNFCTLSTIRPLVRSSASSLSRQRVPGGDGTPIMGLPSWEGLPTEGPASVSPDNVLHPHIIANSGPTKCLPPDYIWNASNTRIRDPDVCSQAPQSPHTGASTPDANRTFSVPSPNTGPLRGHKSRHPQARPRLKIMHT